MEIFKEGTDSHFSEWNHQSDVGTIVEFFFLLKKYARSLAALMLYLFFRLEWQYYYWIGIGLVLVMGLIILSGYLSYRHTVFKIDKSNNEFTLHKGVFNTSKVSIQLDKIIQVNVNQNFIQRLVNVYSVEIETAGSVKSEARLKALDHAVAFALKSALLGEKEQLLPTPESDDVHAAHQNMNEMIHISPVQLLKFAFTADYFRSTLILIGIIFSFLSRIQDYFKDYEERFESAAMEFFNAHSVFLMIVILFAVAIVINAFRSIIKYFQMAIKMNQDTIWITYGLLARKNTVLQNNRTQIFSFKTNPLQRILKVFKLNISQISSDIDSDKKANITIAGADRSQIDTLFYHIYHSVLPDVKIYQFKSNWRLMLMPLFFLGILPLTGVTVLIGMQAVEWYVLFYILAYCPVLVVLMRRYWLKYEMGFQNGFIVKSSRLWTEQKQIIDIHKIQSVSTSQYLWQKRNNLGNLILKTAGGEITFKYGNFRDLQLLANDLLYRIESERCDVG